jgi:hypothetical protein
MAVGRKTGGRQAGTPNKTTAEIKEVARQYGTEAVEKLAELMRNNDNPQVQRAAAEALLDRGYGRPSQAVEANVEVVTRAIYVDPTAHLDEQETVR